MFIETQYNARIYNPESRATDTCAMRIRQRAQSLMTKDGQIAELPDYETAIRYLAQYDDRGGL